METTGFLTVKKGKKDKRYWYVLRNHTLSMYKAFSVSWIILSYALGLMKT